MKINELIGYKTHPIYTTAKALYDPNAVANAQGIDGRGRRLTQTAKFTKFLIDNGFKKLGAGSFGAAFEKPGYRWVFKIFAQDPAYLYYLKYAIQHQSNMNVPRIKGKIIKINESTYAVRMEKISMTTDKIDLALKFLQATDHFDYDDETAEDIKFLRRFYPGVLTIITDMKKGPWPLDLNHTNIMARDRSTPVVLDPIYDPKGMDE